ncbi:hypothetical protein E4U53_004068 [Claviceps sorghi]|nr:hypothetical protein E4U53_004068 [Claviceps sorghi]
MQSFIVSIMAIASVAFAAPSDINARTHPACPNTLYSVPQCCSTNVLNVAALDCKNPKDLWNFKESCADIGSKALCCSIPLAELGVLCNEAIV